MRQRIRQLERQSRVLDPGPATRREMTHAVNAALENFLGDLAERGTYRHGEVPAGADVLRLSEEPGEMPRALALFDEVVLTNGINPASGGHFGYISGGGLYPSALGDMIADVTNRYSGVSFASPGAALTTRYSFSFRGQ